MGGDLPLKDAVPDMTGATTNRSIRPKQQLHTNSTAILGPLFPLLQLTRHRYHTVTVIRPKITTARPIGSVSVIFRINRQVEDRDVCREPRDPRGQVCGNVDGKHRECR